MHEVSCSNPGLCKCAYFIKNCTSVVERLVVVVDWLVYLYSSLFCYLQVFSIFSLFLKNDLLRRVIALPMQIDF